MNDLVGHRVFCTGKLNMQTLPAGALLQMGPSAFFSIKDRLRTLGMGHGQWAW